MNTTEHTPRRPAFGPHTAARRCGPHHKAAAELYIQRPQRVSWLFGESFASIYDDGMVGRIEREVEMEGARLQANHALANEDTLDQCIAALIAARFARRFGLPPLGIAA